MQQGQRTHGLMGLHSQPQSPYVNYTYSSMQPQTSSTASSSPLRPQMSRKSAKTGSGSCGARRRRDEIDSTMLELDSATMRQTQQPAPSAASAASLHFFHCVASPSSRKRSRTLAERLENLSLRVGDKELPDEDEEELEEDEEEATVAAKRRRAHYGTDRGMLLYSRRMKDFFTGRGRQRPLDRIFRHYAAIAQQPTVGEARGNELVVFRPVAPPACPVNHPYFGFTPQELEALGRWESSRRPASPLEDVVTVDGFSNSSCSSNCSSRSNSPRFQSMATAEEDEATEEAADEDVEMDGESVGPKAPHLAGAISHSEWFL